MSSFLMSIQLRQAILSQHMMIMETQWTCSRVSITPSRPTVEAVSLLLILVVFMEMRVKRHMIEWLR